MQNPFKKFQKKEQTETSVSKLYIKERFIIITPISYEELLEVVFLILPYLKLVKVIRNEKQSAVTADIFFDVINNLILQLNRKDLNRALQLLTRQDETFVNSLTAEDLLKMLPLIIRENKLIDVFFVMRSLGAFE